MLFGIERKGIKTNCHEKPEKEKKVELELAFAAWESLGFLMYPYLLFSVVIPVCILEFSI